MLGKVPGGKLARHPEICAARVLSGRGRRRAVVRPSGRGGPRPRGGAGRRGRAGREHERADCRGAAGAGRGLARPAVAAPRSWPVRRPWRRRCTRPPGQHPNPAPLVALAWVHLERNELRETRSCLKQADAALGVSPDKLIGAVAYLVAAGGALAEGRAAVAAQIIARARSGWPRPGLARPAAEPGRVPGLRRGRRHPGRAGRSRTGRHGTRRRRRSPSRTPGRPPETARTHGARSHPVLADGQPGTGPGAPASVAGRRPARLRPR